MANAFKPQGIPARDLAEVVVPIEGLEALRLSDLEKLDQETAAARMNVSRQTFGRVLAEARERKMIRIQGGSYTLPGVGRLCRGGRGRRGRHGPGSF